MIHEASLAMGNWMPMSALGVLGLRLDGWVSKHRRDSSTKPRAGFMGGLLGQSHSPTLKRALACFNAWLRLTQNSFLFELVFCKWHPVRQWSLHVGRGNAYLMPDHIPCPFHIDHHQAPWAQNVSGLTKLSKQVPRHSWNASFWLPWRFGRMGPLGEEK